MLSTIKFSLADGSFSSFTQASGWQVVPVSQNEYNARPVIGNIPLGNVTIGDFCITGKANQKLTIQYFDLCQMADCTVELPLPGCEPKNIIQGVKYVDIGCSEAPYTNQPTLKDWPIELFDEFGSIIESTETDNNGNFKFINLPAGKYTCREGIQNGWRASNPSSGEHRVTLNGISETKTVNFGNCPTTCTCDSIYYSITQTDQEKDTQTNFLQLINDQSFCFEALLIKIDTGTLLDWQLLEPTKFAIKKIDPQTLELSGLNNTLPVGSFIPLSFRTLKSSNLITKAAIWIWKRRFQEQICNKEFKFNLRAVADTCCKNNSILGPELVTDFGFNSGVIPAPPSSNCFAIRTPGTPTIQSTYSVETSADINSANPLWACLDHTNGSGYMMTFDGYSFPNHYCDTLWEKSISVVSGTTYRFGVWVNNLIKSDPSGTFADPLIALYVNKTIGSNVIEDQVAVSQTTVPGGNIGETPDRWVEVAGCWTSDVTGVVKIAIRLSQTAPLNSNGQDFALDDISFRECIPNPCVCPATPDSIKLIQLNNGNSYWLYNNLSCAPGILPILSPPPSNIQITGYYGCYNPTNNQHCDTLNVWWELQYKSTCTSNSNFVLNGITLNNLSISIPSTVLVNNGIYTLVMKTLCQGAIDTCVDEYSWQVRGDTCNCKSPSSFTNTYFYNPSWTPSQINLTCNNLTRLPCIKPGQFFELRGRFSCNFSSCDSSNLTFYCPTIPQLHGQVILNPTTGQYTINLTPYIAFLNSTGPYSIILEGYCGTQICRCEIKFQFSICPCNCNTLLSDVAAGFFVTGGPPTCTRTFKPKQLCLNDIVNWTWTKSGISQAFGTTVGNNSISYTFPGFGFYTISMNVSRYVNGSLCRVKARYSRNVFISCFIPRNFYSQFN
ncbi:MAG: hypothetical protein IPP06_10210 [Saprospiraceae bacterium]|nr:hypothetical protein [Candidatus Vicinibacter affinis]